MLPGALHMSKVKEEQVEQEGRNLSKQQENNTGTGGSTTTTGLTAKNNGTTSAMNACDIPLPVVKIETDDGMNPSEEMDATCKAMDNQLSILNNEAQENAGNIMKRFGHVFSKPKNPRRLTTNGASTNFVLLMNKSQRRSLFLCSEFIVNPKNPFKMVKKKLVDAEELKTSRTRKSRIDDLNISARRSKKCPYCDLRSASPEHIDLHKMVHPKTKFDINLAILIERARPPPDPTPKINEFKRRHDILRRDLADAVKLYETTFNRKFPTWMEVEEANKKKQEEKLDGDAEGGTSGEYDRKMAALDKRLAELEALKYHEDFTEWKIDTKKVFAEADALFEKSEREMELQRLKERAEQRAERLKSMKQLEESERYVREAMQPPTVYHYEKETTAVRHHGHHHTSDKSLQSSSSVKRESSKEKEPKVEPQKTDVDDSAKVVRKRGRPRKDESRDSKEKYTKKSSGKKY